MLPSLILSTIFLPSSSRKDSSINKTSYSCPATWAMISSTEYASSTLTPDLDMNLLMISTPLLLVSATRILAPDALNLPTDSALILLLPTARISPIPSQEVTSCLTENEKMISLESVSDIFNADPKALSILPASMISRKS